MPTTLVRPRTVWTAADLVRAFGPIPLHRIRHQPRPGLAKPQDVVEIYDREKRRYELVDGILLEKAMGFKESLLAMRIGRLLGNFLAINDLGVVAGEGGMMELSPGLVRIPDVSFISWDRFPNRAIPEDPLPRLVPNLAIEVFSAGNTKKEMDRKLRDFFDSGVQLVWFVRPKNRSVEVFTSPTESVVLRQNQTLTGGDVLPEFTVLVRELFAE